MLKSRFIRYRIIILLCLVVVVPLGLASKLYQGAGDWWINDYGGGMLYEVFWILLTIAIWPRASPLGVSVWVLLLTSFVEVLQLWHPPFLTAIRATFVGRMLLGTTFVWWDFPHYVLACGLTWLGLRSLRARILPKADTGYKDRKTQEYDSKF